MSSRRKDRKRRPSHRRRGVTLTELLIVIGLMAFLSSIALVGLWEAQEVARESRARSQVQRIEALLMERWDDYASRAVPIRISRIHIGAMSGRTTEKDQDRMGYERARTNALREIARFELPDRITDVAAANYPSSTAAPLAVAVGSAPSLQTGYRRMLNVADGTWTPKFQGAECLYAILATTNKGEENGLSFFKPSEIGDKDGDGRPEILDPWGNPIEFIRWAPGFAPLDAFKETQTISIFGSPNGGNFKLYFGSDPPSGKSADIAFNASPAAVDAAIRGITPAGANSLDVFPAVQGPIGGPWTVHFKAGVNAPLLVASDSALTGGTGFESVRVTTDFVDPFDPLEAWGGGPPLHPVVVSAGRDGKYGIFGLIDPEDATSTPPYANYSQYNLPPSSPTAPLTATDPPNNPYRRVVDPRTGATDPGRLLGEAFDYDSDGNVSAADRGPSTDNISNHLNDAGA